MVSLVRTEFWDTGSGTVGCAYTGGRALAAVDTTENPNWGRIVAHEVAHNLGREHTDSPAAGEANPDGHYPYADGLIGRSGVDLSDPAAPVYKDPTLLRRDELLVGPVDVGLRLRCAK